MKADPKEIDQKLKEAGYKYLGWQNNWKHVYFDKEGNETFDPKTRYQFGYLEKHYPEFGACERLKHQKDSVQHDNSGSENTVSCDICRIYWKYDCSD